MEIHGVLVAVIIVGILSLMFIFSLILECDKIWKKSIGSFFLILLVLSSIALGMNIGKDMFIGAPIQFGNLEKEKTYKIHKILDDDYSIISEINNTAIGDTFILRGLPKELHDTNKETFELKDVPSITSGGKFISPMLHPH